MDHFLPSGCLIKPYLLRSPFFSTLAGALTVCPPAPSSLPILPFWVVYPQRMGEAAPLHFHPRPTGALLICLWLSQCPAKLLLGNSGNITGTTWLGNLLPAESVSESWPALALEGLCGLCPVGEVVDHHCL